MGNSAGKGQGDGSFLPPMSEDVWERVSSATARLEEKWEEGTYRVSGLLTDIQRGVRFLRDGPSTEPGTVSALADLRAPEWAGAVKGTLRQFEPVTTYALYEALLHAEAEAIPSILACLPPTNYSRLRALCLHLREVAAHADVTRMTHSNLAKVWGGLLARRDESAATDLKQELRAASEQYSVAMKLLDFFGTPPSVVQLPPPSPQLMLNAGSGGRSASGTSFGSMDEGSSGRIRAASFLQAARRQISGDRSGGVLSSSPSALSFMSLVGSSSSSSSGGGSSSSASAGAASSGGGPSSYPGAATVAAAEHGRTRSHAERLNSEPSAHYYASGKSAGGVVAHSYDPSVGASLMPRSPLQQQHNARSFSMESGQYMGLQAHPPHHTQQQQHANARSNSSESSGGNLFVSARSHVGSLRIQGPSGGGGGPANINLSSGGGRGGVVNAGGNSSGSSVGNTPNLSSVGNTPNLSSSGASRRSSNVEYMSSPYVSITGGGSLEGGRRYTTFAERGGGGGGVSDADIDEALSLSPLPPSVYAASTGVPIRAPTGAVVVGSGDAARAGRAPHVNVLENAWPWQLEQHPQQRQQQPALPLSPMLPLGPVGAPRKSSSAMRFAFDPAAMAAAVDAVIMSSCSEEDEGGTGSTSRDGSTHTNSARTTDRRSWRMDGPIGLPVDPGPDGGAGASAAAVEERRGGFARALSSSSPLNAAAADAGGSSNSGVRAAATAPRVSNINNVSGSSARDPRSRREGGSSETLDGPAAAVAAATGIGSISSKSRHSGGAVVGHQNGLDWTQPHAPLTTVARSPDESSEGEIRSGSAESPVRAVQK